MNSCFYFRYLYVILKFPFSAYYVLFLFTVLYCDFEGRRNDFCLWENNPFGSGASVDWTVGTGETETILTGPEFDHTLGDGGKTLTCRMMISCE